jgi:hypothetical protein
LGELFRESGQLLMLEGVDMMERTAPPKGLAREANAVALTRPLSVNHRSE